MWSAVNPDSPPLAAIFSVGGLVVSKEERALFREADPLGFILFTRNCAEPDQLRRLTDDLQETLGRACPVLIDQEGGRVQRLRPPFWREYPAMKEIGDRICAMSSSPSHAGGNGMESALEDLRYVVLRQAEELRAGGINVNCAPVLDVLCAETHEAIGDRAFSSDPDVVARLGESVCRNFLSAGVTPVIKHIPGQGRAALDSHAGLPCISADRETLEADVLPFRRIAGGEAGKAAWGMSAHVVYEAFDPQRPATLSPAVVGDIIRGTIGFEGFLLSDDLSMAALAPFGDMGERGSAGLAAGLDCVLHCSGNTDEMEALARALPQLRPESVRRLNQAAKPWSVAA